MINYNELEDAEIKKSKIFSFFDRFLPSKYNIKKLNMTTGKSEPVLGPEVLTELKDFMEKKQDSTVEQLKGSTSISNFGPIFTTKKQKILAYRTMYMYPDIHKSISIIVNTAIGENELKELMTLNFKNDNIPKPLQLKMSAIFDYLIYDVFDIDNNLETLFKKFLIEGELYIELITDDDTKNIVDFHVLPNYSTVPVYDTNGSTILAFVQYPEVIINGVELTANENVDSQDIDDAMSEGLSGAQYIKLSNGVFGNLNGSEDSGMNDAQVNFLPNQIAYANNGTYGTSLYDVSGYLEPVRKTYNIMNTVDDALAVYRFVRAPETRLWNVFTNGLPTTKADAYLDTVIKEFRKDYNYNPDSGEFSQSGIFNSIIDDYFFAVGEDGNKTTVESLSGAMNLDQLKDVDIHKERLMQGLQIPRSRWDKDLMVNWNARNETTTGEERQFSLLIKSLQRNFSAIFRQSFEVMCLSKGIDPKYLTYRNYNIDLSTVNDWEFWQNLEVLKAKAETYESLKPQIISEDNPDGMLPPKYVFEKVFSLSATEETLRAKYMKEYLEIQAKKDRNLLEKEWLNTTDSKINKSNTYPFQSKYIFNHNVVDDNNKEYPFQGKYNYIDDDNIEKDDLIDSIPKQDKYSYNTEPEPEPEKDDLIDDIISERKKEKVKDKYFYNNEYLYNTSIEKPITSKNFNMYDFNQAYLYDVNSELKEKFFDYNNKYLYNTSPYLEAGKDIKNSGYNYFKNK